MSDQGNISERLWADAAAVSAADLSGDPQLQAERDAALRLDEKLRDAMAITPPDHLDDLILDAVATEELGPALYDAMAIDPPAGLADRVIGAVRQEQRSSSASRHRFWQPVMAFAATFALAIGSIGIWRAMQVEASLSEAVVAHIVADHEAFEPKQVIASSTLLKVAQRYGVRVHPKAVGLRHMSFCPISGHESVHMVVEGQQAPVTILVLPYETVTEVTPVDQDGWKGLIMPAERGGMAIVGRSTADVMTTKARVAEGFEWY